jgi:outer membrane biosynthesis protein TonB
LPPAQEKQTAKPAPEPKLKGKQAEKPLTAAKKDALPDLAAPKPKSAIPEQETPSEQSQTPPTGRSAGETAAPGVKTDGVAVATSQQDFKFGWYLDRVRAKIGQHWSPPPDAADAKARVIFSVNRSGWVGDVNLVADQSIATFTFKQAAIRAIRASNPFPPLPEEFSRQTLEFTVDLMAVK